MEIAFEIKWQMIASFVKALRNYIQMFVNFQFVFRKNNTSLFC